MNTTALRQYTIYCRPTDFPHWYVVRGWTLCPGGPIPDGYVELYVSLDDARECLPPGLCCLGRYPDDDPVIVETWM